MPEEKMCPICNGKGTTTTPMSSFFMGTVNDYISTNSKGDERHRIRLEIRKLFHEDFLEKHHHGDELAIFVIDMAQYTQANKVEDIVEFEGEDDGIVTENNQK